MRRREFIGLLAVTVASRPVIVLAQVSTKRPIIAVLIGASQAASQRWVSAFPQSLQELGYVEHRDYEIEYRYADGDLTRTPALVDELIRLRPNVIVVGHTTAAIVAKRATASIPIIVAAYGDPVSLGLAASLARPQENVTGIISSLGSLVGKQLEFGFELVPGAKRVGMLVNASNVASTLFRQGVETAAQAIAANLFFVEVRTPTDIDSAFQTLARERANIVIVYPDTMSLNERRRIAELAIATRLVAVGRRPLPGLKCHRVIVADESHEGSRPDASYHDRFGYRQKRISGSRDRCGRESRRSEATPAQPGAGILQSTAALPHRHGGLRHGALLGPRADEAWSQGSSDAGEGRHLRQIGAVRRRKFATFAQAAHENARNLAAHSCRIGGLRRLASGGGLAARLRTQQHIDEILVRRSATS